MNNPMWGTTHNTRTMMTIDISTEFAILQDEGTTREIGTAHHYERWARQDDHTQQNRPIPGQFSSDSPLVEEGSLKITYTDMNGICQVSFKSFSMAPSNMNTAMVVVNKIRHALTAYYKALGGTLQTITLVVGDESLVL